MSAPIDNDFDCPYRLTPHLSRGGSHQAGDAGHTGHEHHGHYHLVGNILVLLEERADPLGEGHHAEPDPDGEETERTHKGIVALTRLARGHVQVDGDSQSGHEEHDEHDEGVFRMAADMVDKAEDTENQGQHIVFVAGLVLFHVFGQVVLRTEACLVDKLHAAYPVAVQVVAGAIVVEVVALYVVLAAGKVPHKVAPVHPAQLVAVEELEVLPAGGFLPAVAFPGPVLVEFRVLAAVVVAPHAGEDAGMLFAVDIFLGMCGHNIAVLSALALSAYVFFISVLDVDWGSGGIELAGEERCRAVLLAAEVCAHRHGILRGVLVERGVGVGADHEDEECRIADHQHGESQNAGIDDGFALLPCEPQSPHHQRGQQGEEEDGAAVERQAEGVDEEHIDGRVDIHYAGNDSPQDDSEDDHRQQAGDDESFPSGLWPFLEVDDVEDGGHRQQVQQVDSDGHADQQRDEDQPAKRVRVVALLFPFHDGPEHECREEARHSVDLAFDG